MFALIQREGGLVEQHLVMAHQRRGNVDEGVNRDAAAQEPEREVDQDLPRLNQIHASWMYAATTLNVWYSARDDLRVYCRKIVLLDEVYDYRPEDSKYVEKQDLDFGVYRVEDVPRLCCKTAAYALTRAYMGVSPSEVTISNLTLWYSRVAGLNMSNEVRLEACVGTIYFARDLIVRKRKELGLATSNVFSQVSLLSACADKVMDVVASFGKVAEFISPSRLTGETAKSGLLAKVTGSTPTGFALPTVLLSGARFIAGLPYGILGVKALRPAKQHF